MAEILLEGGFLVRRAVRAGLRMLSLECVPARREWALDLLSGVPGGENILHVMPERELAQTAGYPFHRGVLARAERPSARSVEEAVGACGPGCGLALILPEPGDPENLGACFRNAAALGCGCVVIGADAPDPLSRRVLRVSMGASLSLPWARLAPSEGSSGNAGFAALAACASLFRRQGFRLAACVLDASAIDVGVYARSRSCPVALVMGNEARGLGPETISLCDDRITLPMEGGTDSLNVATAAAIFLFALRRSPLEPG